MDKIMLIPDSSDDEVWFSDPDISASATQSGERKTQTWMIAIESNNAEHTWTNNGMYINDVTAQM